MLREVGSVMLSDTAPGSDAVSALGCTHPCFLAHPVPFPFIQCFSTALGALGVQSLASHPGPGSSEAHPAGRMIGIGLRARTAPSRFLSSFPRKLRENRQFHGRSEPSLRLVWAQNQPTLGKIPGILRVPGKPRGIPGKFPVFCRSPRFCLRFWPRPQTSSQTQGNSRVAQNGAPNTLWFPWKFPETKSAGDPLRSRFLFGFRKHGYRPM